MPDCEVRYLEKKQVRVVYTDNTPVSKWGPFTEETAERVAIQFAASPQVIKEVRIETWGTV